MRTGESELHAAHDCLVGVDLGGTKIEAAVVRARVEDDRGPDVHPRARIPTERDRGYEHVVARTCALVRQVATDARLSEIPPVGVGMPGSVTTLRADGSRSDVP